MRAYAIVTAAMLAIAPVGASIAHEPDRAQTVAAQQEAFRAAGHWIEQRRQYRRIPGISVAVQQGQDTIWSTGFGTTDRAGERPATGDTIYSICSISKLFTAIALMQLWEEDRVQLDAPITRYLPWATLAADERDSVPVTLRGALTHSAGLPREAAFPYWTAPDYVFPSQAEVRERIGSQAALYPASTTFQYSNLGLTLVGETVAAVSGQPFGDYVTTRIIAPLGLDDTQPAIPAAAWDGAMAAGWGALDADGTRPEVALFDPAGITPAAGFSSTANDLARFAGWTFRLQHSGTAEVLRASTLNEMQRVHYVSPDWDTAWGLGFAVMRRDGGNMVGHGGSCPGYRTSLTLDPGKELGIAVLMNAMDDPAFIGQAIDGLLGAREGAEIYAIPDGVMLGDYTGTYDGQPWGARFELLEWAGGLMFLDHDAGLPADGLTRLKPEGGDTFRVIAPGGEAREPVVFRRDDAGRVTAMERFDNFYPRIGD